MKTFTYTSHSSKETMDFASKLANKLNIVSTIGSDFHNFDNIHPVIGLINEDIKIDKNDIINKLLNEK